ncbi:hypothetical protein M407DRAFT_31649 [Tulasnella calospora MUT 4182]|uniref:F-box domain-containing protein n=1 Tax=Tulasnella calospora MUT 4182 TaxID=1051891 RepID=A0A0C3LB05_9AGAM|nr:hypothetical protein M407DRAFT_31649 [Tulasnella calospora MUT 4182]
MDLSTPDDLFELFLKSVAQKCVESQVPCEPQDSLIGEIEALKQLRRDLDRRIIQQCQQRNSKCSFIYRLPLELLVRVFQLTLPPETYPREMSLQLLRSTSRLWRTTVDNTPSLWRLVSGADRWQHLDRAILHSARVPLDVIWDFQDAKKIRCGDFFEKFGPEIGRWRSATLRFGSNHLFSIVPETLGRPAPRLEELVIDCGDEHGGMSAEGPIQLFGGARPPQLRAVWIRRFEVVLSPDVFASLHVLNLHWIHSSHSQLHDILKSCPSLEDLSLAGLMSPLGGDRFITNASPSIYLPKLSKLSINQIDHEFTRFIFGLINAPELDNFSLGIVADAGIGFRWHGVFAAPELSQFVRALKRGAWAMSVTIQGSWCSRVVCEGASTLSFDMSSEQDLLDGIEILKGILGHTLSIPVYLNFDGYNFIDPSFHVLWTIINKIPNITSVLVTSTTRCPHIFMMKVAKTDYASDPWLKLQHVHIHVVDANTPAFLLEMVRCRTGVLTAFAATGSDEYRVIEEVHVGERLSTPPGASKFILQRLQWLQQAMPYGTVFWYGTPVAELSGSP